MTRNYSHYALSQLYLPFTEWLPKTAVLVPFWLKMLKLNWLMFLTRVIPWFEYRLQRRHEQVKDSSETAVIERLVCRTVLKPNLSPAITAHGKVQVLRVTSLFHSNIDDGKKNKFWLTPDGRKPLPFSNLIVLLYFRKNSRKVFWIE